MSVNQFFTLLKTSVLRIGRFVKNLIEKNRGGMIPDQVERAVEVPLKALEPEQPKYKPLPEREIVRPWTLVAPKLWGQGSSGEEKWGNVSFDIVVSMMTLDQIPLPWDSRGPIAMQLIAQDWRMILNLYIGLELPFDLSRPMVTHPYDDFLSYELVENSSDIAFEVSGVAGGGHDALHNALLIVCGATAGAARISLIKAVRCANLVYYMATGFAVGEKEEVEDRLRELSGKITLQDATKAVFDYFDIPHTGSNEFFEFEHSNVWL